MSLQPIPNQPIGFVATRLKGALCGSDPTEVLPTVAGDVLSFQFQHSACDNTTGFIGDQNFEDSTAWRNLGGWVFGAAVVCKERNSASLALEYAGWSPTIGVTYQLNVIVDSLTGSVNQSNFITVTLGGVSNTIYGPGNYLFNIDAISNGRLLFVASNASVSACMSLAQVVLLEAENDIVIKDIDGLTIETFTYDTDPGGYLYSGGFLTVFLQVDENWGPCFTITIEDPCNEVEYTSQRLAFAQEDQTIPIKACNAGAGMGFSADFAPIARYISKLSRSTFAYEEGVERGTNGYINNYYGERLRTMSLAVDDAGEIAHNFLSSLSLWDHVYFEQDEYRVKGESYEPDYADIYDAHGSIILAVEPKQESLRKVRCGPDVTMGCVPPPNYLVQGVGPNDNYVLLQAGGRVRLHG